MPVDHRNIEVYPGPALQYPSLAVHDAILHKTNLVNSFLITEFEVRSSLENAPPDALDLYGFMLVL